MTLRFIIPILLLLLAGCSHSSKSTVPQGTVIILNGTSGVGKSTIQKKLQELFEKPYLKIGIDNLFVGVLPEKYLNGTAAHPEEIWTTKTTRTPDGKPIFALTFEPDGRKMIAGMHRTIAAYAHTGNNVVVDYILYDSSWLPELLTALKGIRVYFVGIQASLDVIEQREKDRATSPQGHARSIYDTVHTGCTYDLFIDTTNISPDIAAIQIKEFIDKNPTPQAFKNLNV